MQNYNAEVILDIKECEINVYTFLTIFTVLGLPSIKHHIIVAWSLKELMIHVCGGCWEDLQKPKYTKLQKKLIILEILVLILDAILKQSCNNTFVC
jgi:hypothetical protein